MGGFPGAFFVAGNTYKITWNGTPYVCTAVEIQDSAAIGNLANFGGAGNNEPFAMSVSGDTTTILILEESAEYIVSISEFSETVHTMASEFLPAGVGGNNREFIIDVGDGFYSATTYADVLAAIKAGKCPIVYWNAGGSLLKSYGYMVSEADGAVGFVFFHAGSQIGIAVTGSGWGAQ